MTNSERELAEAAARLTVSDFDYLQANGMLNLAPSGDQKKQEEKPATTTNVVEAKVTAETVKPKKKRKRTHRKREWPEVGAVLQADYSGEHYEAEVIEAKQYQSGRALKVLNGPAAGKQSHSFSGAMLIATENQREQQGLGRKGVANGWDFWKEKRA